MTGPEHRRPLGNAAKGLTPRQREVLDRILQGKGIKRTAKELKIATGTVKIHRYFVFQKLGVSRATDLMALHIPGNKES